MLLNPPIRGRFAFLGLGLAFSACQVALVPNQKLAEHGELARGWVQDSGAIVRLEAFDHCEQGWREVTRAWVASGQSGLGRHAGHAWQARVLPASFAKSSCLFRASKQRAMSFALRVRAIEHGVEEVLPSLTADGLECLADAPWKIQSGEALLAGCETLQELPLLLGTECPFGHQARKAVVPLSKAGNLRRLRREADPDSLNIVDHFEHSLLVGHEPPALGLTREYRNYLLFERPGLPAKVRAAWVSWFVNFDTTLCAHRQDIGCGYASEDAYEDFVLSFVDVRQSVTSGSLALESSFRDPESLKQIFGGMERGLDIGQLRLRAQDVDRWFEIPLSEQALGKINATAPGELMMVAGRVRSRPERDAARRKLLFVDHLIGTSLDQSLEPRLNLLYCAPTEL